MTSHQSSPAPLLLPGPCSCRPWPWDADTRSLLEQTTPEGDAGPKYLRKKALSHPREHLSELIVQYISVFDVSTLAAASRFM